MLAALTKLTVPTVLIGLTVLAAGRARAYESPAGNWLTQDKSAVIAVAPCGASLCGRIAAIMIDHSGDKIPVDHAGRSQCNLKLFSALIPDGPGVWRTTINNPNDGGLHPALVRVDARHRLRLRGYVFIPLLGQTQIWTAYRGPLPADCRINRF